VVECAVCSVEGDMADGTQFKGAMRCEVELPYKLMVNVECKKV